MRVVTARALAPHHGGMNIGGGKRFAHLAMAGQTKDLLLIAQQGAIIVAMRIVAATAIFLRRRMRIFFRKGFFQLSMAAETKLLAHDFGQALALGTVRGMTGRAAFFHQRLMGVSRTGLSLHRRMASGAESDLGRLEQFWRQGSMGKMTGQTAIVLKRQMEGAGPRELRADLVMTGKAKILARGLQEYFIRGAMHFMAGGALTCRHRRVDLRLL